MPSQTLSTLIIAICMTRPTLQCICSSDLNGTERANAALEMTLPKIKPNQISIGYHGFGVKGLLLSLDMEKQTTSVYTKFQPSVTATLSAERLLTINFHPLKFDHSGILECYVNSDVHAVIPDCAGQMIFVNPRELYPDPDFVIITSPGFPTIQYDHPSCYGACGSFPEMLPVGDTWKIGGFVYVPDPTKFKSVVRMRVCRTWDEFPYTQCTPGEPSPSTTPGRMSCKCTNKESEKKYRFLCVVNAVLEESDQKFLSRLESSTDDQKDVRTASRTPTIYKVMLTSDGAKPITLPKGAVVTYPPSTEVKLCAETLGRYFHLYQIGGYYSQNLKVSLDGARSEGNNCVIFTTPEMDKKSSYSAVVKWSGEDRFSFSIKGGHTVDVDTPTKDEPTNSGSTTGTPSTADSLILSC